MADDRYKWLDGEAAERLLRGRPVNARSTDGYESGGQEDSGSRSDGQPPEAGSGSGSGSGSGEDRPDARLAAALSRLVAENAPSAGGHGAAELPGEAAAVDAFRAAHAEMPGSVTLGLPEANGRCGGRRRPSLRGRPVRAGFVTALAGCALGGVAVAAGTGVLPAPFGGNAPVTKVSPANSRDAGGGGRSGSRQQASPGGSESSDPGDDDKRSERGRHGGSTTPGDSPDESRTSPSPSSSADADRQAKERKKRLAKLFCAAYEKDELAADDRKKFERAAGGPHEVKVFCARHGVVVSEAVGGQNDADGGSDEGSGPGGRPGSDSGDSGADEDPGGKGHSGGTSEGNASDDGGSGDGATDGSGGSGGSGGEENSGDTTAKSSGGSSAGPESPESDGASASPEASPSDGGSL